MYDFRWLWSDFHINIFILIMGVLTFCERLGTLPDLHLRVCAEIGYGILLRIFISFDLELSSNWNLGSFIAFRRHILALALGNLRFLNQLCLLSLNARS